MRTELARGFVMVFCLLQMLFGAFGLYMGFVTIFEMRMPMFGLIVLLVCLLRIAIAVLMLIVTGLTESRDARF